MIGGRSRNHPLDHQFDFFSNGSLASPDCGEQVKVPNRVESTFLTIDPNDSKQVTVWRDRKIPPFLSLIGIRRTESIS